MQSISQIFHNLSNKCDKFEHYFELYERYFSKFVGKAPKILEVGVQFGGSAEMWRKYFGEGTQVVGVDIKIQAANTDYLTVIKGDQGSDAFWDEFSKTHGDFDIIIDDGSHDNPQQITTLKRTYNLLRDGGIYWCEDTHTSYYHNIRVQDGGYKNPNSFTEYAKNIIDVLSVLHTQYCIGFGEFDGPKIPAEFTETFSAVRGVHFHDSVVVIEKQQPYPFKRHIHGEDHSSNLTVHKDAFDRDK
jgi:SAM-dependent methyltransferase